MSVILFHRQGTKNGSDMISQPRDTHTFYNSTADTNRNNKNKRKWKTAIKTENMSILCISKAHPLHTNNTSYSKPTTSNNSYSICGQLKPPEKRVEGVTEGGGREGGGTVRHEEVQIVLILRTTHSKHLHSSTRRL